MRSQPSKSCLLLIFLLASWLLGVPAHGQSAHKAIVLAWDGIVPAFVQEMLGRGQLPHLSKLIAGGSFGDDVMAVFPSKTAPGFAALMTGAPPRVTGISGNRVLRAPHEQFTILESLPGFSGAPLKAEPLWASAQRAGKKTILSHIPVFAEEKSEQLARFSGYELIAGRDGIVTRRALQPQNKSSWVNAPPSGAPAREIIFTIAASTFYGLLIDDPADVQRGYDTLVISQSRDGERIQARLKAAVPAAGGELFWSQPVPVRVSGDREASVYFRLFDLKPDGSDFFLYYTRPVRPLDLPAGSVASPTVRSFVGNGAAYLYQSGALGETIAHGGDGSAEARYLETILFAQHQLIETNRWAMGNLPWDLFLAYTPFPDEAEHAWRGMLDTTLPTYRPEIADKIRPYLERVYRSCDDFLGFILSKRPANTIVAVISDHGLEGVHKRVALNVALRQHGLLTVDGQGRVNLAQTKALYPSANGGYVVINSSERKNGIVARSERGALVQKLKEILLELRDGERQIVAAIIDADTQGKAKGIGGETGGDLYVELAPGYDFDPRLGAPNLISEIAPLGGHGGSPEPAAMRTLMVFNGPGIKAGQRLIEPRLIDFAPTLAWLLDLPNPKDANGRVLYEAFSTD